MRFLERWFSGSLNEIVRATAFPLDKAKSKSSFVLIYSVRLIFLVSRRLWWDRCPRQAAALAFQTMLSLVPLLVVGVAVVSTFALETYREKMMSFAKAHLLPDSAGAVGRYVLELASNIDPGTLGIVGGATLVFVAMTLLFTVEQVINEIFHCNRSRRFFLRAVTALMVLLGTPVAYGLSLMYTAELLAATSIGSAGLPLVLTIGSLYLCYWLLPHTKIKMGHALISAVVAGILLEAVKIGFAFYAAYLGSTLSYVYGTFAILPLFMVWIYVAWLIFLFGAEFNAALHEVKTYDQFKND